MKTTATIDQLQEALKQVNESQGYQLSFERIEQLTKNRVIFTLKSPSKVKGARVAASGRNLAKASWHAHGHFFDLLFKVNPLAIVFSQGKKITIDGGNWQDIQVGSFYSPKFMSELSIR